MARIRSRGCDERRRRSRVACVGTVALIVCLGFLAGCSNRVSDESIENGIKAKMFSDAQLKDSNVTVTAHDGTVTLSGEVASDAARADANQIAKAEPGVTQVNDQMTVAGVGAAASNTPAASSGAAAAPPTEAAAPPPVYKVIPHGTEIAVRTNDNIDSKSAAPGQTYSATIAADVVDASGAVAIPKGSDARLVILKAASSQFTTQADLALDLDSVTVAGTRYRVATEAVDEKGHQGLGKNKRTAEMTGGGAALGAIIGAIAGKGKGAAIGGLVGAGGGAGAQVLTKGKEVRIPSETVLRFRLEKNLRLAAS